MFIFEQKPKLNLFIIKSTVSQIKLLEEFRNFSHSLKTSSFIEDQRKSNEF